MMRHLKYLAFVACLGSLSPAFAAKLPLKSLTVDDLVTWQLNHGPGDLGQRKMGSLQDGTLGR